MYRKQADRLIVRDIRQRVAEMQKTGEADWRLAVVGSAHANPAWFGHYLDNLLDGVGRVLRNAGVDLPERENRTRFVGNEGSSKADEG